MRILLYKGATRRPSTPRVLIMSRRFLSLLFVPLYIASSCRGVAPSGPWDAFNFAPTSRTVRAETVRSVEGAVQGAQNLVGASPGTATLSRAGSYIVLDFSKEVGLSPMRKFSHLSSPSVRRSEECFHWT